MLMISVITNTVKYENKDFLFNLFEKKMPNMNGQTNEKMISITTKLSDKLPFDAEILIKAKTDVIEIDNPSINVSIT